MQLRNCLEDGSWLFCQFARGGLETSIKHRLEISRGSDGSILVRFPDPPYFHVSLGTRPGQSYLCEKHAPVSCLSLHLSCSEPQVILTLTLLELRFHPRLGPSSSCCSASAIDIANVDSTSSPLQQGRDGEVNNRTSGCSPENIAHCLCHWR